MASMIYDRNGVPTASLTLSLLCKLYGRQEIARVMGIAKVTLDHKLGGQMRTHLEELWWLKRQYPEFDVEATVQELGTKMWLKRANKRVSKYVGKYEAM